MGFGSGPDLPPPPAAAPPPPVPGINSVNRRRPRLARGSADAFSLRIPRPEGTGTNYGGGATDGGSA